MNVPAAVRCRICGLLVDLEGNHPDVAMAIADAVELGGCDECLAEGRTLDPDDDIEAWRDAEHDERRTA